MFALQLVFSAVLSDNCRDSIPGSPCHDRTDGNIQMLPSENAPEDRNQNRHQPEQRHKAADHFMFGFFHEQTLIERKILEEMQGGNDENQEQHFHCSGNPPHICG